MTKVIVELSNNTRLDLLLAFLRRLGTDDEVKVAVEENGQSVARAYSPEDDARFEALVEQIIQDVLAGKIDPLPPEEEDREERELAVYGEQKAQELAILTDDDIVRLINQDRCAQREKAVA
jgi:hypothetical protein